MILRTNDHIAPFVLRLALGIVILPHGLQKTLGSFGGGGFGATLEHFTTDMGIPTVLAVLVILAESLGALGLILGLLTRICALGIGAVMVGAIVTVHWQYGFFMNWFGQKQGEGFEFHLLAIGIALALAITGGGKWSVDRAITAG